MKRIPKLYEQVDTSLGIGTVVGFVQGEYGKRVDFVLVDIPNPAPGAVKIVYSFLVEDVEILDQPEAVKHGN